MESIKIDEILEQRGNQYGEFKDNALTCQYLKHSLINCEELTAYQREALEMIFHKISRIINGNPFHVDSWEDIAGFAILAANEIKKHYDG